MRNFIVEHERWDQTYGVLQHQVAGHLSGKRKFDSNKRGWRIKVERIMPPTHQNVHLIIFINKQNI